jgi:hypothetical protein
MRKAFRAQFIRRGEGQQANEGSGIGKEDLRQVQGDYAPRRGAGDLRKRKAQAAPGVSGWRKREGFSCEGTGIREQGTVEAEYRSTIKLTSEN